MIEQNYYRQTILRLRGETLQKFNMNPTKRYREKLSPGMLKQLDRCADDSIRRLILGINEDGSRK